MNPRFSEYVTSGAFNMALTRGQIADLTSLAEEGASYCDRWGALERRGLIERIPSASVPDPFVQPPETERTYP